MSGQPPHGGADSSLPGSRVRTYLPATTVLLRRLLADRELQPPLTAFAVTPGLRAWYVDDDVEELEYAALLDAARASLRLLDADPNAAHRRVVVALDAAGADVEIRDDLDRGVVRLTAAVPIAAVASVHIDELDAEPAVRAAADAVVEADLGSARAQDTVDDAEGFALAWYATQELGEVLDRIG